MLQIQSRQYAALGAVMARRFEDRAVEYFCPADERDSGGPPGARWRRGVHAAIARARGFGLDRPEPLMIFIELAIDWGCGFGDDPQVRWAAACLRSDQDQHQRGRRLQQAARDRIGARSQDLVRLATYSRRLATLSPAADPAAGNELAMALLRKLASHPLQASDNHDELLEPARDAVRRFGLADSRALATVLLLMVAHGHRCCDDPMHDWMMDHLADGRHPVQAQRIDHLLGDLTGRLERAGSAAEPAAPPHRLLPGDVRLQPISLDSPRDGAGARS